MTISKYLTRISLLGLFVVFILLSSVVAFVTDWWWFSEVGYTQIFIKSLIARIALFSAAGIFAVVFFALQLLFGNPFKNLLDGNFTGGVNRQTNELG